MAPNATAKRYTLTGGENTYSSPASVNENDARKLQSLIPSLSGALERERPVIPFTNDAAFPSRIGFFHTYKQNNQGSIVFWFFMATATTLYVLTNPGPTQSWQPVSTVNPLHGFPVARNINNQMHLSDGVNSWIFGGVDWVKDGLEIPLHSPTFAVQNPPASVTITSISRTGNQVVGTVSSISGLHVGMLVNATGVADSSFNGGPFTLTTVLGVGPTVGWTQNGPDASSSGGTLSVPGVNIISNRFYWTTYGDQSTTHPHEGSSSPISAGTGAQTGKIFVVQQRFGTVTTTDGINFTGIGTDFAQDDVGKVIYAGNPNVSVSVGVIKTVTDATHLIVDNTKTPFQPHAVTANTFTIAPLRATHWNVYASSSEEDKLGNLLATVPLVVTQFTDTSPMLGTVGAQFQSVQRPLLNDPTPPCTVMEVSKNRIWRNLLTFPNFFTYTGFEEILAEQAGTPSECVPGADPNTVSPGQVNETSYPDQSSVITGLCKHGDALYIGTELNITPMYGSSLADFQLSEAQAFAVGLMGRKACCTTPFGFAFVSYDLKVYLYPSQYSFGVDSTTALVELGRPKRPEFENIDGADFANVGLTFYNWGRRNWLVLNYRRTDQTFATWVFDFEVKGWFQLQQGYTAVAVFETTLGRKSLIAAGTDNKTYVIDDLTGNFPVPPGTNYPVGYARYLLDFTDPASNFETRHIEFEKSNSAMEIDVTIWLDPNDPENPGTGIPIPMTKTKLGANRYSGRPNPTTGGSCQRVLVEFAVAASPQNGTFRGFTTEADKIASPVL